MKQIIFLGVFMLFLGFCASAQFVGAGTEKSSTTQNALKPSFSIKFGAALPLSPFSTTPERTSDPQYSSGFMGAKTGFFTEFGFGLNLTNSEKVVGFYYYPVLASLLSTSLDWSELGGIFADKSIYTKPFSVLDIAQRYGISVKPAKDFSVALYYRPGLIIPFKYEIATSDESFLFTGELSTSDDAPALMMSHTAGLSIRYKMVEISVEKYSAKPTFDITYKDNDQNVDISTTGKIPVKLMLISLALDLNGFNSKK